MIQKLKDFCKTILLFLLKFTQTESELSRHNIKGKEMGYMTVNSSTAENGDSTKFQDNEMYQDDSDEDDEGFVPSGKSIKVRAKTGLNRILTIFLGKLRF